MCVYMFYLSIFMCLHTYIYIWGHDDGRETCGIAALITAPVGSSVV